MARVSALHSSPRGELVLVEQLPVRAASIASTIMLGAPSESEAHDPIDILASPQVACVCAEVSRGE